MKSDLNSSSKILNAIVVSLTLLASVSNFAAGSGPPVEGPRPAPEPVPAPNPEPTPAPSPEPDPAPETEPVSSGKVVSEISAIATKSTCAKYRWKNRSVAPSGYMSGMALSFAKSLCRQRAGTAVSKIMAQRNTQLPEKDAITWYEEKFDAAKLEIDRSGAETLRSLYTLGVGLGMRESSGKYCEGWDKTAKNQSAVTAEAGVFQFSYNSMNASVELKNLYTEYKNNPSKCHLSTFKKNVTCKNQDVVGTGAGAEFQKFVKRCPAFAAEYAMVTLRILRKHYGPINRLEAEVNPSCNQMLDEVQDYVVSRPSEVCKAL
jgi:hypothetical protein